MTGMQAKFEEVTADLISRLQVEEAANQTMRAEREEETKGQQQRWEDGSTIGEDGDTTISSPGRSPKKSLPGMRLHGLLHGLQACPEIIAFDQGVGQIFPP